MSALAERERIMRALSFIPADLERDEWWRIGAALRDELGEDGFDLFDRWSSGSDCYKPAAAVSTWRSIQVIKDIHIATLIGIAKRYGFDAESDRAVVLSQDEIARRERERTQRRAQVEAEMAAKRERASLRANAIWDAAAPAHADHPYLQRKRVQSLGLRVYQGDLSIDGMPCGGSLIVPLRDAELNLVSVEFIDPSGEKRFLPGGAKSGAFHLIGDQFRHVVVAEGYATAASIHEATGYAVAVAFDAGNLRRVGKVIRDRHPTAVIVFAADNDAKPDGSNPGLKAAKDAAISVAGVVAIPPAKMDMNDLRVRDGLEAVKDTVDAALPAVWPAMDERPCWRVYSDWQEVDGVKRKPGVWHHNFKQREEQEPVMVDEWICSPLFVDATTSDKEDDKYGFLLRYVSRRNVWKKWAMPAEMLASDGAEALGVLLSAGVEISQHKKKEVLRYIASQHPKRHMRAATATGWHDGAFVLPDEVIGADDIWFQATGRRASYGMAGTLEDWQAGVAAIADENPLVMLAISAGLAGVLLGPLCIDGAGLHIYGDSSTGKTTALVAGISVWGGSAFRNQWRTTANGLEGIATMHSDTVLALDELGEAGSRDISEGAYALSNGIGKNRANKHGEARSAARWRVFVLSTGEITIGARIAAGGIEAKAGQSLRILDIPVAAKYGLFDNLCGMDSGARLSDALRDAAAKHYGHAGRRFVQRMVETGSAHGAGLSGRLAEVLAQFDAPDGQERRAARVLAVAALAGEMAIEFGITKWKPGSPTNAAIRAFKSWQAQRGSSGRSAEHAGILQAVSDFIDSCGDARFSDIDLIGAPPYQVRDRAGYWKKEGGKRLFMFTSAGMREAIKGYDLHRSLAALDAIGAIARKAGGKNSVLTRIPEGGRTRLYVIDPEKLDLVD